FGCAGLDAGCARAGRVLGGGRVLYKSGSAVSGSLGGARWAVRRAAAARALWVAVWEVGRDGFRGGLLTLLRDGSDGTGGYLLAAAGAVRGLLLDCGADIHLLVLRSVALFAGAAAAHAG